MAKYKTEIIWKDRTHHMWFPISFTKYTITNDRLYVDKGFFNTTSDETLLYRVIDLKMRRSFLQKIFGTGDITLYAKADSQGEILLHNIKKPWETKELISDLVEKIRNSKNVVGKEFYSGIGHEHCPTEMVDMDGDGIPDHFETME